MTRHGELLSGEELARYLSDAGDIVHAHLVSIDSSNVPAAVRHLIPLARRFGIKDDAIRLEVRRQLPPDVFRSIKQLVSDAELDLESWLAGPEARQAAQSDEYLAFASLFMFADET